MNKVINFLKGKKTYITGLLAIAYGLYFGEVDAVLMGLGLMSIRNGITTEVAKTIITQRKKRRSK